MAGPDRHALKLGFAGLYGEQSEGRNCVLMAVGWVESKGVSAVHLRHWHHFPRLGLQLFRMLEDLVGDFALHLVDHKRSGLQVVLERIPMRLDRVKLALQFQHH